MVKTRSKVEKPKKAAKDKIRTEDVEREVQDGPQVKEDRENEEEVEEVESGGKEEEKEDRGDQPPPATVKEEETAQEDLDSKDQEDTPSSESSEHSLSQNTDYIALTSALSMLTRQQETSKRDLVKLSQMRQQAVEQPEQFLDKVKGGEVSFPKALYVTMVPSIDWKQYDFENRELDGAIERQRRESERGVVEEVPLFNQ